MMNHHIFKGFFVFLGALFLWHGIVFAAPSLDEGSAVGTSSLTVETVETANPARYSQEMEDPAKNYYGPTEKQDSLEKVAKLISGQQPSVTTEQVIVALIRKNPQAFVAPNSLKLKQNVFLELPTIDEIQAIAPVMAQQWVASNDPKLWTESDTSKEMSMQQPLSGGATEIRTSAVAPTATVPQSEGVFSQPTPMDTPDMQDTQTEGISMSSGGAVDTATFIVTPPSENSMASEWASGLSTDTLVVFIPLQEGYAQQFSSFQDLPASFLIQRLKKEILSLETTKTDLQSMVGELRTLEANQVQRIQALMDELSHLRTSSNESGLVQSAIAPTNSPKQPPTFQERFQNFLVSVTWEVWITILVVVLLGLWVLYRSKSNENNDDSLLSSVPGEFSSKAVQETPEKTSDGIEGDDDQQGVELEARVQAKEGSLHEGIAKTPESLATGHLQDQEEDEEISYLLDLARAYIDMGDEKSAEEALERVIQRGDHQYVVEAKTLLEKIRS